MCGHNKTRHLRLSSKMAVSVSYQSITLTAKPPLKKQVFVQYTFGGDRGDRSGAAICFVRLLRKPSALYVGCGSALRQTAATSTMGFDPLRPFMDTNKDSGQSVHCLYSWWRQRGSNPRPHGCEPCALTS